MKTEIKKENNITTIIVEGNLDTINASGFYNAIEPLLSESEPEIMIDCEKLAYISSSGLRLIMMLQKSVTINNGHLVIKSVCPAVMNVFTMTGFTKILTIK